MYALRDRLVYILGNENPSRAYIVITYIDVTYGNLQSIR